MPFIRCKNCKSFRFYKTGLTICKVCGAPLNQQSQRGGVSPSQWFHLPGTQPLTKICPSCGKSGFYKKQARFCRYCGASLTGQPAPTGPAAPAGPAGPTGRWDQAKGYYGKFKDHWKSRPPFFTASNIIILLLGIFLFLDPYVPIPVQIRVIALGGLIVLNLILRGHPFVTVVLIIFIGMVFFIQTVLGQSIVEQAGFTSYVTEATLGAKYGMCYFTNAFNVNVLSTGNLDQFCQKQIYGFRAEKQGCVECITTTLRQRTTGVPGRDQIIEAETALDQTATTAANNITVRVFDSENGIEAQSSNGKCTPDKPCTLTIYDDPVVSRFKLTLPCKDSLQYKSTTTYTYYVEGQSEFKIRQGGFRTTTRSSFDYVNGLSSSGPLSFAIKSDSPEYIVGDDRNVYVNFYLYNEGRGTIKPMATTVTQTPPNKNQYLELVGCEGSLKATKQGKDKIILEGFDSIPFSGSDIVTCQFTMPASIKAPFLTYKFIGVTQYWYSMDIKDTVLIDLLNYPCKITTNRWKIFSGGNPGSDWAKPGYNDDGWGLKDLPDSDWSCINCDKYYRKNVVWDSHTQVTLNVSSDDGAACFLNGDPISEINAINEARPCGAGKRNCFTVLGNCADPKCQAGWDYTADITERLKPGTNLIACQVHNINGPGYFNVQG